MIIGAQQEAFKPLEIGISSGFEQGRDSLGYNQIMDFKIQRLITEQSTQAQGDSASQAVDQTSQLGIAGSSDMQEISRPDFFSGEMLNPADLQHEQDYHIGHSANQFLERATPETMKVLQDAGQSLREKLPQMIQTAGGNENTLSDLVQDHIGTNYAILGSLPDGDIEALAFLVLMQAAKSAQEDLKAIMASVKAINSAKASQRKNIEDYQELGAAALLQTPDAMHGEPKDYDQLQTVVQDLQTLLNSLPIPNQQKLELQSELNQLNQLSHQIPIQPQGPDQNFAQALQLLQQLRSQLSQYTQ